MMCDTSLTNESKGTRAASRGVPGTPPVSRDTALTCGYVESDKVIDWARTGRAAHPQFGPVVDLAYTRWRATW